ncbi:MAG TPA: SUF system NifU family Fe-S cluster assembly protein [Thermoplasmata archaeon]|nr:SUF system NifU family Fe-S cluster assembly protein [Thermoplasmata archaeon]
MPTAVDLYQEVILDHSRKPRNFHRPDGTTQEAKGHNPLCGDAYAVYLRLEGDRIADVGFEGQGCAISKASASLMTAAVKGRTRAEAEALFETFHRMVKGEAMDEAALQEMGKLRVLQGVSEFPVRVKCASLAWHTLKAALERRTNTVSLE